jgi:hypothetical protein
MTPVLTEGNDVFIAARVSAPAEHLESLSLQFSKTSQGQGVTGVDDAAHGGTAAQDCVAPQNVLNAQRLLFRRRDAPPPTNATPSFAIDTRCASVAVSVGAAAVEHARELVNFEAGWFCLNAKMLV